MIRRDIFNVLANIFGLVGLVALGFLIGVGIGDLVMAMLGR